MASAPPSTEIEQEVTCPICLDFLTHPMVLGCGHSFCQGCITDYCEKWEPLGDMKCPLCKFRFQKGNFHPNWQLANLVEKIKQLPLSSGKDLCLRHKEKLHFFCKEDEQLVCIVCERSPEHQGHTIFLEEARQQYKHKIFNCLEILKRKRKTIQAYIAETKDESQQMLKRTESEKQKTVAEFRALRQFLEEQENHLLAQIEEVEKEVARKIEDRLAKFSEELSSLESLIQEMEEKFLHPVSELLQGVRGTLQRYEETMSENPEDFPPELLWKVWNCCYNPFLDRAMRPFREALPWASPERRAMVTLEPASASSHLVLSGKQKVVKWQSTTQDSPEDPEKFYGFVLGREGFTGGCHFWEVLPGCDDGWAAGVARKPVKGRVTLTPEEGIWAVGRWKGPHKNFRNGTYPLQMPSDCHLRICLNYDVGQVAFYDFDRAALLYEFSGASFSGEALYPFFAVYGETWVRLFP
ncbi:tripartite motif-containing protein 10-like [Paroedura picta]|uniref:tripartite motif-containing protein 10-like n=1 Tax=Paroedura picta TaxID=143630 RepID=UPI004055C847